MKALLYVLPLFSRLRGSLFLTLILSLVTLAAGIGLLGISGWFLTAAAITTAGVAFNLFGPSAGVRGLSFVRILSRYGEKVTGHDATLRLLSDLRRTTFAGLFRLVPVTRLYGRADLVSRLVADLDALDSIFLVGLGPIMTAIVAGTGMAVLLGFMLPGAAPIYAIGFALAALGVPAILVVASSRLGTEIVAASTSLRSAVLDAIDGHQDLILFDAVAAAQARAESAAARLSRARLRLGRFTALASAAVQGLAATILLSTLLCGLDAVHAGRIDGPLMVGLVLAVVASFEASAVVVRSARGLAAAAAAAERLSDLAAAPSVISETAEPEQLGSGGAIDLVGVHFGYRAGVPVLDGLTLHVPAGGCLAIRGPSGGGKSTITQLLVRLIDPDAGNVFINGHDLRHIETGALRRCVALMTQDSPVFRDTVRANLLIGHPDADDEALWAILVRVGLNGVIRDLPGGLDAVLGEDGRTLSAGQARRICLARTLLSPASIVVLDEPTAGLDAEAEQAFLRDVPRVAAGRTMILVTHAELPPGFGGVVELRAGRIIEPIEAAA
ncbi:MAG: thiol reductant ABC exporter subunit CydC [Devosia sp.]